MTSLRILDQVASIHCAMDYEDSLSCNPILATIDYDDFPSLALPHHESDRERRPANSKWCVEIFRWAFAL